MHAQSWQTVFFDNFNRTDGPIGNNYSTLPSAGITQIGVLSNEIKVANGDTSPAYWIINYVKGIDADSIRISCKFRAPNKGYGFSIAARDNGVNTYRAGLMANTDTIAIYRSAYSGNSTTLAGKKANLDSTKTYYLEFTLKSTDLSFKFVQVGMTDTLTLNATDNLLTGNGVNLSAYYFLPKRAVYIDDFKIESFSNSTGIDNINREKNTYSIFPNPASDQVTLNIDNPGYIDLTCNVYNVMGALVKSEMWKQSKPQMDLSDLKSGIYTLEIRSKEWTGKQKLMIQK